VEEDDDAAREGYRMVPLEDLSTQARRNEEPGEGLSFVDVMSEGSFGDAQMSLAGLRLPNNSDKSRLAEELVQQAIKIGVSDYLNGRSDKIIADVAPYARRAMQIDAAAAEKACLKNPTCASLLPEIKKHLK
jgi:hypothetical protein